MVSVCASACSKEAPSTTKTLSCDASGTVIHFGKLPYVRLTTKEPATGGKRGSALTLNDEGNLTIPPDANIRINLDKPVLFASKSFSAIENISALPRKQVVSIGSYGLPLDDRDFRALANFDQVNEIDINTAFVSDKSTAQLVRQKPLKKLRLENLNIRDQTTEELAKCPSLEFLKLEGVQASPANIAKLLESNTLKAVTISNSFPIHRAQKLPPITLGQNLIALKLRGLELDMDLAKQLGAHPKLVHLDLSSGPAIEPAALSEILKNTNLIYLGLPPCVILPEHVAQIMRMRKLEYLSCDDTSRKADINPLAKLPHLRQLVSDSDGDGTIYEYFKSAPAIEELTFRRYTAPRERRVRFPRRRQCTTRSEPGYMGESDPWRTAANILAAR